jgi:hypothetical protein
MLARTSLIAGTGNSTMTRALSSNATWIELPYDPLPRSSRVFELEGQSSNRRWDIADR